MTTRTRQGPGSSSRRGGQSCKTLFWLILSSQLWPFQAQMLRGVTLRPPQVGSVSQFRLDNFKAVPVELSPSAAPWLPPQSSSLVPPPTSGANRDSERKPWLLFTSAGDHSNVAQWLPGRRYDVMVSYYGDGDFPWKDVVDIFRVNKDCKFCNIQHV